MRFSFGLVLVAAFSMTAFAKDTPGHKATKTVAKTAKVASAAKKPSLKVAKGRKGKFEIRLLSYKQLAKLSKPKRLRYLRQMRDLLVTMERYQKQHELPRTADHGKLKDHVASLLNALALIPEAEAAERQAQRPMTAQPQRSAPVAAAPAAPREPLVWEGWVRYQALSARQARLAQLRRVSMAYPVHDGVGVHCAAGTEWNDRTGVCLLENVTGGNVFAMQAIEQNCPSELFAHIPSPERGTTRMSLVMGACVPRANWDRIGTDRQTALKESALYPVGHFSDPPTPDQIASTFAPGTPPAPAAAGATAVANADPATPATNTDPAATVPAPSGDLSTGIFPTPPLGFGNLTGGGGAPPEPVAPPEPAVLPAAAACMPAEELVCSSLTAADKQTAIAAYRASGHMKCVNSGFLTEYASNPDGSIRGCPRVEHTPAQGTPCPANERKCNPAAFCVMATAHNPTTGAGGEAVYPFCVSVPNEPNPSITLLCSEKHTQLTTGGAAITDTQGFVASNFKACDPATISLDEFVTNASPEDRAAATARRDDWERLKRDTEAMANTWCTESITPNFRKAFCTECETIRQKISEMGRGAGESNCAATVAAVAPSVAPIPAVVPDAAPSGTLNDALPADCEADGC